MNDKRIRYFDMAKGIGILCVIAGHMSAPSVCALVFTFHMPLFFLISGYFVSERMELKQYCYVRTKQLMLPYFFTGFLYTILMIPWDILYSIPENIPWDIWNMASRTLYGAGSDGVNLPSGISAIGAIWFLPALLCALIIVRYAISVKYGFVLIFISAIISYISSKYIWLPLSIQAGGVAVIFVYIGYLVKQKGVLKGKINLPLFFAGIIVLIAEYEYGISVSVARNYYAYGLVSIVGAVLICYTILSISRMLEKNRVLKRILCFYGENSLIILCFHLVEMGYFPWYKVYEMLSYIPVSLRISHVLVWISKVLFCTVCVKCVFKSELLKKIFGRK